jgi:uncharacterized protein YndB with AHSA1/START domain
MRIPTDRLGTVLHDGDRPGLRYVRRLRHPRDKVWYAITTSEQLRHWFPTDIVGERAAGAEIELPFWPDHVEAYDIEQPVYPGRVHVWDPPRLFEWSWDTDRLRWELTADGDETILTLTVWIGEPQAHGAEGGSPDDATGTASAAAGYHLCLDHLQALLDDADTGPLVEADLGGLQARYRDLI